MAGDPLDLPAVFTSYVPLHRMYRFICSVPLPEASWPGL